jgi:hypothetical protein
MTNDTFDTLLFLARPAAGKSEIIHYLETCDRESRRRRFHIADFVVIDDFPMLWDWFEEDDILASLGHPRLHTDPQGMFIADYLWDVLIHKINLKYHKFRRDNKNLRLSPTALIEFSRGSQHGGYTRAFAHLSAEIASRAAILYVNVSFSESLRKNRRRFNPERPDSILEHSLSDEKIDFLYRETDWDALASANPGFIPIQGYQVPYAVFENEDDVTTAQGAALGSRLEQCLNDLWGRYAGQKR